MVCETKEAANSPLTRRRPTSGLRESIGLREPAGARETALLNQGDPAGGRLASSLSGQRPAFEHRQASDAREANEIELVARLRAGDAAAVGPYIELHRRGLLSHIERTLGAGVRAKVEPEDVLQEVSLTAFTALPRYDLQDRHPLNWLYQIAHRRIVGAYRRYCSSQKRASHRESPLYAGCGRSNAKAAIEWLADEEGSPETAMMRRELLEQVGRLWARLSHDQRETLRMRYVEGKPFKEIGEALGKTDCAVRVLLCRTLDRLQTLLDDKD